MDGDARTQTTALPSEQVLRWVTGAVGGVRVVSVENASNSTHRPSGTFRVRLEGTSTGTTDLILKVFVPRWITDGMVITNARALRLAETHGLPGPRLIAADLDGKASGAVASLAEMAAREMGRLGLLDALDYLVLLATEAPDGYNPAARRWLSRLHAESPVLTFDGAELAYGCLRGIAALYEEQSREVLRALVKRRHETRGR